MARTGRTAAGYQQKGYGRLGGKVGFHVEKFDDLAAADADYYLAAQATSNTVITTVTTFLHARADVPKNIVIDPGGTLASVPAGDIVIVGLDRWGDSMTETITTVENDGTALVGTKAFAKVTSIVFPIQDGAGATYDVGTGKVVGLSRLYNARTSLIKGWQGTAADAGTLAVSATVIEGNTYAVAGTPDGADEVVIVVLEMP